MKYNFQVISAIVSAFLITGGLAIASGPTPPPGIQQNGAVTTNHCAKWSGNGVIADAGGNCGTGAGTVTTTGSPVNGDIAIFSSGTAITTAAASGTGAVAHAISPVFVAPTLGVSTATSINFGGNALNAYQEGSWTPVDASGAALTFATATGMYTKIGRMVFIEMNVLYPSTANASGSKIGGLPFTVNASSGGGFSDSGSTIIVAAQGVVNQSQLIFTIPATGATYTNAGLSTKQIVGAFMYFN